MILKIFGLISCATNNNVKSNKDKDDLDLIIKQIKSDRNFVRSFKKLANALYREHYKEDEPIYDVPRNVYKENIYDIPRPWRQNRELNRYLTGDSTEPIYDVPRTNPIQKQAVDDQLRNQLNALSIQSATDFQNHLQNNNQMNSFNGYMSDPGIQYDYKRKVRQTKLETSENSFKAPTQLENSAVKNALENPRKRIKPSRKILDGLRNSFRSKKKKNQDD